MGWGYSPRRVVRTREAPLDRGAPKGPRFLLVLVGICAAIFVFGVVTEILNSTGPESQPEVMIQLNGGVEENQELLVNPDASWEKGEDSLKRGYRILWKKPQSVESKPSLWETVQEQEQKERQAGKNAEWDQHGDGTDD